MRRDPIEIMVRMLKELQDEPCSLNELSQRTGLHNVTVRKYVRLIEIVRKEPEIEIIKTKHSIIVRRRGD
jgi:response regulator of citrate/malate metabolism